MLSNGYFYTYKDIDRGIIEKVGPWGIISGVKEISNVVKTLQSGFIYYYLYFFLLSFIFFLFFLINISFLIFSLNFLLFLFISYSFFNKKE